MTFKFCCVTEYFVRCWFDNHSLYKNLKTLWILSSLIKTVSCDLNKLYEYCNPNQKLCEIPSFQTLCPYPTSELSENCSNFVNQPLSNDDKMYILSLHNKLRNRVATGNEKNQFGLLPTASNMLKLHWDVELEAIAEMWAERCLNASVADSYDDCRYKTLFNVTQNMGIIGSKGIVTEKRILRIFYSWYSKNKLFNLSSIDNYLTSDEGDQAKEYTNLIWADSYAMGCSRIVLLNNASDSQGDQGVVPWTFEKIICNYVPGGNIPGRWVYKRGAPCSDCPKGMKCSIEFPGLCTPSDTEVENDTTSLIIKLTTNAEPEVDNGALQKITSIAEEASKLFQSNMEILVSDTAKTKLGMTDKYSELSSQIPMNERRGFRTETPKLLVKVGIYLNGKCHCPDVSRFAHSVRKNLPAEVTQKLKNQVFLTRENPREKETVEDGKSTSELKQGDRCYCMRSTSKGFNISVPSRFLYTLCICYFITLVYYIQ